MLLDPSFCSTLCWAGTQGVCDPFCRKFSRCRTNENGSEQAPPGLELLACFLAARTAGKEVVSGAGSRAGEPEVFQEGAGWQPSALSRCPGEPDGPGPPSTGLAEHGREGPEAGRARGVSQARAGERGYLGGHESQGPTASGRTPPFGTSQSPRVRALEGAGGRGEDCLGPQDWPPRAQLHLCLPAQVRSALRKRWHRWQDHHSLRVPVARAMSIPTSPTRISFHSIKQTATM